MDALERCTELLDKNHIPYIHSRPQGPCHASCGQKRLYVDAKLVFVASGDFYAMFVLPADRVLDLKRLAVCLGLKHVRLASKEEIQRLFPGFEIGPFPFGERFHLPVYLDERLTRHKCIAFHIGPHRDGIYMRLDDYVGLVRPRIVRVAYPELQSVEQKQRRN